MTGRSCRAACACLFGWLLRPDTVDGLPRRGSPARLFEPRGSDEHARRKRREPCPVRPGAPPPTDGHASDGERPGTHVKGCYSVALRSRHVDRLDEDHLLASPGRLRVAGAGISDPGRSAAGEGPLRSAFMVRSSLRRSVRRPIPSCVNDPSAGSPTETLLRLLLPLDDQV